MGAVAYKLKLPQSSKIHPVFHVSQLKKAVGDHLVMEHLPETLEITEEPLLEPIKVCQRRTLQQNNQSIPQILVQWQGQTEENATWVNEADIRAQFPHFSLEDKASSQGGGNDRNPATTPGAYWVYTRRGKAAKRITLGNQEKGGDTSPPS